MQEIINKDLTNAALCSSMYYMDMIKKAIKAELKRRGWSTYRLIKELNGKLPERTVYSYLSEDKNSKSRRDISAERASIILKALGLKIKR